MALNRGYLPPSLKQIPSKGNVWHVIITKPEALREGKKNIQIRRSTGTTDLRLARTVQSKITEEIYAEWDRLLQRNSFAELLEQNGFHDKVSNKGVEEFIKDWGKVEAAINVWYKLVKERGEPHPVIDEIFGHLDYQEALEFRRAITPEENPYPTRMKAEQAAALRDYIQALDGEPIYPAAFPAPTLSEITNHTGCTTILGYLPDYMGDRKWNTTRKKTKAETKTKIEQCAKIVGDLPLDQILSSHGFKIASELEAEGKSNSTIKAYVNALSVMLTHASQHLIDTRSQPFRPYIVANPLKGISLKDYGTAKRSWEPLTEAQLFALFKQPMPNQDRLLLSILITTGMRLDEAALLTKNQLKTDRHGIRYFDLSAGAIIKNDKFAARTVALPDCLILPKLNEGYLFDFPRNSDGKASSMASKELNQKYFHPIRATDTDDRKVVHSLRHNLSGFLLNLTDPSPSTEHMNWITGHGMQGGITESERQRTYGQDPDVKIKYDIVNRIKHPWLN